MRYQVVAVLRAPAEVIRGRLQFGEAEIKAIDAGTCEFRAQGDSLEWLAFLLIWLDVDFEVQEPIELIDYFESVSHRLEANRR
jgi:hypothetical protein